MERIGLDQKTLKALAAETRVRILKLLDKKPATLSDVAEGLGMSLPTIGEHLKALEDAGLVEREQTERKWKYYSLTQKARILLHPNTTTIWFVLGLFLFSAAGTIISALRYFSPASRPVFAASKMAAGTAMAAPAIAAQAFPVWLVVFGIATIILLVVIVRLLLRHGWVRQKPY